MLNKNEDYKFLQPRSSLHKPTRSTGHLQYSHPYKNVTFENDHVVDTMNDGYQSNKQIIESVRNFKKMNRLSSDSKLGMFVDNLKKDELKTNRTKYAQLLKKSSMSQNELTRIKQLSAAGVDVPYLNSSRDRSEYEHELANMNRNELFWREMDRYENVISNKPFKGGFFNATVQTGQAQTARDLAQKNRIGLLKS